MYRTVKACIRTIEARDRFFQLLRKIKARLLSLSHTVLYFYQIICGKSGEQWP